MAELLKIQQEFYEIDLSDAVSVIRFYEKNQIFLDNTTSFQDKSHFDQFILILSAYVISLENLGRHRKACNYADRFIHAVDSRKDKFSVDLKNNTAYWAIVLTKGRTLYNLKDYKGAIPIFERLLLWDPENDNFKNWLRDSKSRKRRSVNGYIYTLAILIYAVSLFLVDENENRNLKLVMNGTGLLLTLTALLNDFVVDKVLTYVAKNN